MTDLVSILDELLGNVQELLEFFRHGDVCGEVSNEANVSARAHHFPRILFARYLAGTPSPQAWKVSSLLILPCALSAKYLPENCRTRRRPLGA